MAASTYDEALRRLLIHEGGYSNHPSDPGGATNFGITIYDYRRYVNAGASAADVKAMKVEDAKSIYRAKYWNAMRCDELPAGLDYAVFDYGVNSGIGRSGKVLRRLLKLSDASSMVSDEVIAAVRRTDAASLVAALCEERLAFLQSLKTWPVFGKGWGRRVAEVRTAALAMAASPRTTIAPKVAVGGVIASGAVAAQQAQAAGVDTRLVIVIIVIILSLAFAASLAWRWWNKQKEKIHGLG
jgi:lysozyme family protein